MKKIIFSILLFTSSSILLAREPASSPKLLERGKTVFLENCIACHGERGDGNGVAARAIAGAKPRDFTTGYFRRGGAPAEVFHTISEGSEGTAMPAWKDEISEDDRWALAFYVRSLKAVKSKKNHK